jgi:hypothetical protein
LKGDSIEIQASGYLVIADRVIAIGRSGCRIAPPGYRDRAIGLLVIGRSGDRAIGRSGDRVIELLGYW